MNKKSYFLALNLFVAFYLPGCGGEDGASDALLGVQSSCDLIASLGECLDYGPEVPTSIAEGNCSGAAAQGFSGTVSKNSSCTTTNRVGTCVAPISGTNVTYRFYTPTFTSSGAQNICTALSGSYTAG